MNISQNDLEHIKDQMQKGQLTADEANVQMVLMQRVRVVSGSIPMSVRKALNAAVKQKVLGHIKKDGLLPEVYFHPTFDYLAKAERKNIAMQSIKAIRGVLAINTAGMA